ncbi:MAG: hypothetical protein HLUCCO16_07235 [Phormidium sp. OSCR]|nr:MAG: hypothetical protein HLUCCO16_07235 [Phormidium sp. OSCR]
MYQDPIVEEIHKIREEYSQSFNHDLKALFADLQKQQAESGRKVVNLSRQPSLTPGEPGQVTEPGEEATNSSHH